MAGHWWHCHGHFEERLFLVGLRGCRCKLRTKRAVADVDSAGDAEVISAPLLSRLIAAPGGCNTRAAIEIEPGDCSAPLTYT